MTRPQRSLSNPTRRVLPLAAACLTLLGLPAEGQIHGRRPADAGPSTLGAVSAAAAVSVLDCDPSLGGEICVTATCGEDPSCRAPRIPDLATVTSDINLSRTLLEILELEGCTILDLNVAAELHHTFPDDLEIRLKKVPGPGAVLLEQGHASAIAPGDDLAVLFDDERSLPGGSHPVVRPATPLSGFNGRDLAGLWRLQIEDQVGFDSGELVDWGLSFAVDCPDSPGPTGCTEDSTTLCLNEDRFRVTAGYRTPSGDTGSGRAVELTDDTGYLWFFDPDNVEVVVKVLDACSFANHFWVFAAGLTNVEVDLAVVDTQTGFFTGYRNALNEAFKPIQDTSGLPVCP